MTAVVSPPQTLSRLAATLIILLGEPGGDRPSLEQRVDWLDLDRIEWSFGTARTITLTQLPNSFQRLEDLSLEPVRRVLEVRRYDDNGELTEIVAWGLLKANPDQLNAQVESIGLVVTLDDVLFGHRAYGYRVHSAHTGAAATDFTVIHEDIVFNPIEREDEAVRGNRSPEVDDNDAPLWVAPDALGSASEESVQGTPGLYWYIPEAVFALCWLLNPDEEYLQNPTLDELKDQAGDKAADEKLIRNIRIKRGTTLPEALAQLLKPIDWAFEFVETVDTSDPTLLVANKTQLKIFERRQRPPVTVSLLARGEVEDGTSQTDEIDLTYDITERPNAIEAQAELQQFESTFTLSPGWDDTHDSLTFVSIENGHKNKQLYRDVGTLWVLNESGSYLEKRAELTGPYDLRPLLGSENSVRRRKFERCLTLADDQNPVGDNGYLVEWKNPTSGNWEPVQWAFSVLQDECGIQFTSPVPQPLWQRWRTLAAANMKTEPLIRITAVVESDRRLSASADRDERSPLDMENRAMLDLEDKYKYRKVATTSTLYTAHHEAIEAINTINDADGNPTTWLIDIDGDHATTILKRKKICILGSTGNDGRYTVDGATYSLGSNKTTISVSQRLPDDTIDGVVGFGTLEESDYHRMKTFLEEELAKTDGAAVSGTISLIGLDHWSYRPGDLIDKIEGREIDLNRYTKSSGETSYPEVTRLVFDVHTQTLVLTLE